MKKYFPLQRGFPVHHTDQTNVANTSASRLNVITTIDPLKQWCKVTKNIYSSTNTLLYNFEILFINLSIYICCCFVLLLHYNSRDSSSVAPLEVSSY